jgi:hypothetical protein
MKFKLSLFIVLLLLQSCGGVEEPIIVGEKSPSTQVVEVGGKILPQLNLRDLSQTPL